MECLHCNDIVNMFDDVSRYNCFVRQERYNDSKSLFVEKKNVSIKFKR